jgi:hypothetical protein
MSPLYLGRSAPCMTPSSLWKEISSKEVREQSELSENMMLYNSVLTNVDNWLQSK